MRRQRVELVVTGQVVLRVVADGSVETAEAIGIGAGRVVVAGTVADVQHAAPASSIIRFPGSAVVPGLHDFHLHLVGMARQRREASLDGLRGEELVAALAAAAERLPPHAWLRGRGWSEDALAGGTLWRLNALLGHRPALLYSHDAHSAWASPAALVRAGIGAGSGDPAGGRIERDGSGNPTGVLRETATDLVEACAERLRGAALDAALDEVLAELAGWGVTGATDAGDTAAENGTGAHAALGDRASLLLGARSRLEGRLRLAIGFPADAIGDAAALGLRTGAVVDTEATTLRAGWAKAYADGALGSRTAALFEPYSCEPHDTGILRLQPDQLDRLIAQSRETGIGLAVHAIGDRAAAAVLDAEERANRLARVPGAPPDRIEHLQLLRPGDRRRLARLGLTASMQPGHCAADREHVGRCWSDRAALAYPWRSLRGAGARLAFGSDAPIETANPWAAIFAAAHRRWPGDGTPDWQPHEALSPAEALGAYTIGPATAAERPDEGHLRPGAVADLAVLDADLATVLAGDERTAAIRSVLTLVGGREMHRS
ncbi:MAG TPA: amidohydrolase [Candidatus Limnocylindria bacterium]